MPTTSNTHITITADASQALREIERARKAAADLGPKPRSGPLYAATFVAVVTVLLLLLLIAVGGLALAAKNVWGEVL